MPQIYVSVMLEWIFRVYAEKKGHQGSIHLSSEEVMGENMFLVINRGDESVTVNLLRRDGEAVQISVAYNAEICDGLDSAGFATPEQISEVADMPIMPDSFCLTSGGVCLLANMSTPHRLLERTSLELLLLRGSFLKEATRLQKEWGGDERSFNFELSRLKKTS